MSISIFRMLPATLFALASSASFGQMGGGPMSTTQYFPLVDGARYEYVFVNGPRTTATAVMHGGQAWGGVTNLTSVHMTFVCKPATTCADDATDFYRMDPDGMHYYGGDGNTPADDHFMMTYSSPEWMLKNPVLPGTMMGPGSYQGAEMWQMSVQGMNSMTGAQSHMSSYQALALESVTTPMGTFTGALHVHEQRGSGYSRDVWYSPGVGMVRWMDGTEEAVLAKVTMPTGPVPAVARAVEYFNSGLGHYFMTANAAEIDALDSGKFVGWQRTGMSFNVVDPAANTAGMASSVCRYYGSPAYGLDTHFYSASPDECALVHSKWPDQWILESSNVFQVYMPNTSTGACPAGMLSVYRTWNQRADTNHRYTMDARVQTMMMGSGFVAEGYGNPPVAMCSPQ
jgi:hypothetical protein